MSQTDSYHGVKSFFVGQSISVCIATTSILTQFLANNEVYLAFTQTFGSYLVLSFFMLHRFLTKKTRLHTAWWKYLIVAVVDAEANFLIIKSYEYTTILSVMLCDAMCIPSVVIISLIFFHTKVLLSSSHKLKFGWRHYFAVFLCLLGLAIMIIMDSKKSSSEGTHRVLGDMMALAGSVLYAVSNTCQEALVKHDDWEEFLGMIGIGGSIISLSQLLIFERTALMQTKWSLPIVLFLGGFVIALVLMYIITATFLQWNDAVVFNMHLLTSDVIAAILSYVLFNDPPSVFYFVALAITIVGVIIYNSKQPTNDLSNQTMRIEESTEGHVIKVQINEISTEK